ncbi:hypothetical protein SOMG_04037 [Schizosaccharomyces osmophilus]|uniref:Uncharacterized protein n=1 Tax=Schizosaccharomyces osmophilus TaxID=2545709 RepID=A0AAE9WDR3_9SCHI|nr:uncharacterized protein SOMG_04037 [Schizosaccharomyces osmophilus]WBW74384.1 hypothetical protein SOMG_04037 [Schizosaccharomyces osmophilus]
MEIEKVLEGKGVIKQIQHNVLSNILNWEDNSSLCAKRLWIPSKESSRYSKKGDKTDQTISKEV